MIDYLIKSALCSGLFLLFYLLFLEKEKMHKFNRFYLLFSIIFSAVVPLLVISTTVPEIQVLIMAPANENTPAAVFQPALAVRDNNTWLVLLPWLIYISVCGFFLFRFGRNIYAIGQRIKNNSSVPYQYAHLILTDDKMIAHSFLQFIFVDREDFQSGRLPKEIITHELAHAKQRHSIDILFLELLLVFAWWNPFLFLYRRAIKLNHEFLADDGVLGTSKDIRSYQYLLLSTSNRVMSSILATPFNYSITKKRLIMMTKRTSHSMAIAKVLIALPLLAISFLLFSSKVTAQQAGTSRQMPRIESAKTDAPKAIEEEYAAILERYRIDTKEGWRTFHGKITAGDKARLEVLYKQMSIAQQDRQRVGFMPAPPPFERAVPNAVQFNNFKDAQKYGVWINDKKVSNAELDKYQRTDFSHFFISRLYGAAKKGRTYTHQLNLMTNDYFEAYYKDAVASKDKNMMFTKWGFGKDDVPPVVK